MLRLAGALVALGALMMFAKGGFLVVTGNDRSLIPAFGIFTAAGFGTTALYLWRSVRRLCWLTAAGGLFALGGLTASLVAVGYLVTGTIPETDGAPAAVGTSYVGLTVGVVVSLLLLGIVITVNRSLPGRWRWLPVGLLLIQFPIFIVADAAGEASGAENVTDGLGLALTGAAWMLLGYTLALHPNNAARENDRLQVARPT